MAKVINLTKFLVSITPINEKCKGFGNIIGIDEKLA